MLHPSADGLTSKSQGCNIRMQMSSIENSTDVLSQSGTEGICLDKLSTCLCDLTVVAGMPNVTLQNRFLV